MLPSFSAVFLLPHGHTYVSSSMPTAPNCWWLPSSCPQPGPLLWELGSQSHLPADITGMFQWYLWDVQNETLNFPSKASDPQSAILGKVPAPSLLLKLNWENHSSLLPPFAATSNLSQRPWTPSLTYLSSHSLRSILHLSYYALMSCQGVGIRESTRQQTPSISSL